MNMDISPLFRPLQIREIALRNRVVMPPMVVLRDVSSAQGVSWYAERARGGVGLVITGATAVNRFGSELTVGNLRPLTRAIHDEGGLIAVQLFPVTRGSGLVPAQFDRTGIQGLVDNYRRAAEVCVQAGFDGVEPHGAHGYLLNQFFSPTLNERTDEWGGSLENRMRLALQIVAAIRPICGDSRLLLYRHTPVGPGYGIEESLALADALIAAGIDILDLSPSSIEAPGDRSAPFVGRGVPVIAVNELDQLDRALCALNEKRADLIAVGRGLIADPEWPNRVRDGRSDEIVTCIRCGECSDDLAAGRPSRCSQWARES